MQAEPYPDGFAGAEAEHPSHWMVPVLVEPHALAAEVQALP